MPKALPVRINDYIYYRRFDNPADALTLYRFPLKELQVRGLNEGQVPIMKLSDDENVEKSETIEDFPEEPVFSIGDLTQFY